MNRSDEDIGEVLEGLARTQPSALALHFPGRASLSYADLSRQIDYLRERMSGWGYSRGDVIAGVIPARAEMAVVCAALPAAATFSPLSPTFSPDVYAELLIRLGAKALIVPAGLDHPVRAVAKRCGIAEIALTADPAASAGIFTLDLVRQGSQVRERRSVPADVAYVLCTSGTTGLKKLVPIGHGQVIRYARSMGEWFRFSAADVGCLLQPLHLGSGVGVFMTSLLAGTSLVCLPEADADAFFAALDEYGLTWMTAGFTLHREILERAPAHSDAIARSRLRFLRQTSGRLEPHEIDRIEQVFGAPLLVTLSTTEALGIAMSPLPPRERKRGSVGLPLINAVRILGGDGRFCASGEAGEIVVRGPLVFDGYLDDARLSEASFTNGWLRTGDLGWLDEDGYLFLSGRATDIINRGGEKISPVEIDVAIESLDGVRAAAAFAVPHPTLGEEVVAAVVRDAGVMIAESEIVDRVRQRLGARRVPRRIYFVDEIPRTDNGKIRRSELARRVAVDAPVAASVTGATQTGAAHPPSAMEAALCGLWSAILEHRIVGTDDDFFLAGGDSLRGVRLLTSVKAVFGVDLEIETLFGDGATIAGMARAIENARAAAPHHPATDGRMTIAPRRAGGPAALSSTQKRMWFLSALEPGSSTYNETRAFRLAGQIDVDALRLALRRMVRRHEILRTTYSLVDGEPRQIVHGNATIDLHTIDVRDTPAGEQLRELDRLLLAEAERAFDLMRDFPLRLVLVRLSHREHALLIVVHHIASDRWSSAIRERELSACYNAFKAGLEPALPALPIQYADYAQWQSESLQTPLLHEQLGYWKSKLAGLTALELPTDRPRPPAMSYRGARAALDLPQPLSAALKALGRREGATLFMTLLAGFQVLLHRYSGQDDITVGAPIAGRVRSELEPLIGFFVNTLVLRTDLSGNPPFREALARVRENALAAYAHQDLPFEKLVEELGPARDRSRHPLFQVMFALRNTPEATFALDGLELSPQPLQTRTAKFDLMLALRDTPGGLQATWDYSTDLFDAQTIERMARHFGRLLQAVAEDPEQRIGELRLLDDGERHRLLVEWNDTARDYPADRCMHELFEEHAARTADAVAVVCERTRLTYGELDARANRLAHHLIARGVGPDVLVGICVERSPELVVGLLGILKAGGAYVPLDPAYPKARLAFMLNDARAPVLLTQESLLERLPRYDGDVLCLDRDWPHIAAHSADHPSSLASARSLAYVMYTSGSTGNPKGVLTEHRSVVRLVKGADYVSLGAADTLLHLAPLSFDASTFELWGALLNGGRVVLMPPGQPALAEIGDAIRRHGVTTLWLTAGLFHLMVDERLDELKPLRQLVAGGDVLSVKHVLKAGRALPGCRLINGYGPTENTTFTCCYMVSDESEIVRGVPIGRPIANTRVYVLDKHGEPVPVGVSGELYAAGDGVARGYLNQPELSAEKFVADPHSPSPGARMYRTGDRVRYRPNGSLEFLGRIDHQVKIRGFRIEPGEIEAALSAHASIRQAVVLAREDKPGDKRLVACVAPARGGPVDTEALRGFLSELLPEHMHPSAYVVLEGLPLLPSGKIDRSGILAASQAPYGERPPARAVDPSPRDTVAETMCRIWQDLLGIAQVGLDDDFFELGGHSLLAVALFSRLDAAFGRTLPLATLFKAPTVRELARIYRERAEPAANMALVPITAGGALPPVFAVPGVGGNVLCYADMARELGPAQPLYGLQSVGLDGACEPLESIGEMAAQFIRELRQVQARGPYHLMGACFGATVAFEMARQLIASGEEVAFLGLLDPSSMSSARGSRPPMRMPVALKRGVALGSFITGRLRLYRDETRALGFGQRVQFLRKKIAVLSEAMQRRDVFRGDPREFHQRRVNDANLRALLRYRHEPLTNGAIAVEIFRTARRLGNAPANGRVDWGRVVGASATYHNVPGKDSGDMLQGENAKALAAVLRVRLEHARSACSGSSPRC